MAKTTPHPVTLATIAQLRAFLGDKEAAASVLRSTVHSAVLALAQHGDRNPLQGLADVVGPLFVKGLSKGLDKLTPRERALHVAFEAIGLKAPASGKPQLSGVRPGTFTADDASARADEVSDLFFVALSGVLNAKKEKPELTIDEAAAMAAKLMQKLADVPLAVLALALQSVNAQALQGAMQRAALALADAPVRVIVANGEALPDVLALADAAEPMALAMADDARKALADVAKVAEPA